MRTKIPRGPSDRLLDINRDEIVYFPVSRENWLLVKVHWAQGDDVACEVIAEGEPFHVGKILYLDQFSHVYRCTEMEVLAWAAL